MLGIDYLEQNKSKSINRQIISTLTSLGGYIIIFVGIGMFLDKKFFKNSGIVVIVSVMLGILFVVVGIIRLVMNSNDS
jgi:F0F1-type ATP synthase assembly protein I